MEDNTNKTFVFESEETQQSTVINYQINCESASVDLNFILQAHCPLTQNLISIYNPDTSKFVTLDNMGCLDGIIPQSFFEPTFVLIRFSPKCEIIVDSNALIKLPTELKEGEKDSKNKQRTIGQTLGIVKQWRNLHLHGITTLNRRLNLQDAANVIGISKKSLDDYYSQLRFGEYYHFDYVRNLGEKIGMLRAFVRNQKSEEDTETKDKNHKLPKRLKIIKYYDCSSQSIENVESLMRQKQYRMLPFHQDPESQVESMKQSINSSESQSDAMPDFSFEELPTKGPVPQLERQFLKGFIPNIKTNDAYQNIEKGFGQKYFEAGNIDFNFSDL